MKVIRHSVFETNSSSTHTLTLIDEETYEAWKRGEMLYSKRAKAFTPLDKSIPECDWVKKYLEINTRKLDNGFVYQDKFYPTMQDVMDDVKIEDATIARFTMNEIERHNADLYTYQKYQDEWRNDHLEPFSERYTTKSGDRVIAFGYYGDY
jgi:hypothetical protein